MMTEKKKQPLYRIGKLENVGQVCHELSKLYRRATHGQVDTNDAARLSGILANLRAGLEQSAIELRLSMIEDTILRLAASKSAPIPLLNGHTVEDDDGDKPEAA